MARAVIWLYIVLGTFGAAFTVGMAFLLLAGHSGLGSGRAGRLARLGRMSARLSTSWLGATVRRLFAGKDARVRIDAARRRSDAEAVTQTMGSMKGAFMKLGQMMSFVTEDVPEEYRLAMASLQASAPPMDLALLRDVAERELGQPLERAFARFDDKPLAAASIGQVHRAQLPDGREVVVKIQYPGVAEAIRADLDNVAVLYRMMGMFYPAMDPKPIVAELRARLTEELDYTLEARSQQVFGDLYADHPFIRVPAVIASHSTAHVLTSEYVAGRRFAEILADDEPARSRYAEILYRWVFGSILHFGVFNGDPHPGNYLFDAEGRVVFLDFGCVKYFPEAMLESWRNLVTRHFASDHDAFRGKLVDLGFLVAGSDLTAELLYDYFGYFYEPFRDDQPFHFSREYNARSFRMVFAPDGKFAGMSKKLNMPADFVFANRIQWGVYSILGQLNATANWHRVHRELLLDEPPATELGRLEAAHWAKWRAARGFGPERILLTPEGVRRREVTG